MKDLDRAGCALLIGRVQKDDVARQQGCKSQADSEVTCESLT